MAESADDGFDFVVDFPSPTPDLDDDAACETSELFTTNESFYSTSNDEADLSKQPVVMLFGWMGCDDKHLAKYSEMYIKKGCVTIRYIPPIEDLFYDQDRQLQKTAMKLLELLFDMELEKNPLFFHVFSNGGGYVYRNVTEQLRTNPRFKDLNLRGCIFDSCPSPGSIVNAAMGLAYSYNGNILSRYLYAFFTIIYLVLFRCWEKFIWTFRGLQGKRKFVGVIGYYSAMMTDPTPCPQLYLYSKADRMIKYTAIENVIKHRRSQGIVITAVCWDDSGHVAHMRSHRESYMKKCYDFVDTCLS